MKSAVTLASLAWLASIASAHTIFQELYVNGVSQGHLQGIRVPDYDGVRLKHSYLLYNVTLTSLVSPSPM